jgi:hypothetical protein
MGDECRVAVSADLVTAPLKLAAKLAKVVELAVKDRDHIAVFAPNRLVSVVEIDDRETAVPEYASAERLDRTVIRTPM